MATHKQSATKGWRENNKQVVNFVVCEMSSCKEWIFKIGVFITSVCHCSRPSSHPPLENDICQPLSHFPTEGERRAHPDRLATAAVFGSCHLLLCGPHDCSCGRVAAIIQLMRWWRGGGGGGGGLSQPVVFPDTSGQVLCTETLAPIVFIITYMACQSHPRLSAPVYWLSHMGGVSLCTPEVWLSLLFSSLSKWWC